MKRKALFAVCLLAGMVGTSPALLVTRSYSNGTSDDDSVDTGDAITGTSLVGGASSSVATVGGSTTELGARFYGANSGRGVWNGSQQPESIVQSIDVTYTWTISAESWEVYDFSLSTALHGLLNIEDNNNDESGDIASLSGFAAMLSLNGSPVSDSLGLTGGSRSTVGSSAVNDTASQILSGLSGNNMVSLRYTGTATATWKIAGFADNRTADAVLWGADGTMDGGPTYSDTFDNYSSASAHTSDGLFVSGSATLQAIPEPATLGLIGLFGGGLLLVRRIFTI